MNFIVYIEYPLKVQIQVVVADVFNFDTSNMVTKIYIILYMYMYFVISNSLMIHA